MSVRLAAFAVGLLAAFGAAFGLGRAVGPTDSNPPASPSVTTTSLTPAADAGHGHGANP
jgi:hypothetical protein